MTPAGELPVVLIVGFPDSVHTMAWIRVLLGSGMKIVLLPVYKPNENANFRMISSAGELTACPDTEFSVFDLDSVPEQELERVRKETNYHPWQPAWLRGALMTQAGHAVAAIQRLKPRLVHSMVVQFGGYLTLGARDYLGDEFPVWLLSNWGSDIFLFRMFPEHQERLRRIATLIDAYHAECARDVGLIRQMGFRRFVLPVIPATGGADFEKLPKLTDFPPPSARRDVIIKGYHGWSGRALHLLSAVHLAADALRPFTFRITLASEEVRTVAQAMAKADGLHIVVEPYVNEHMDVLRRLGNARILAGAGISDGISTTLLEAMAVGAFPVQGTNSCGNEWVVPDKTGIFVSPHDVGAMANALRRAATDDELVDSASIQNRGIVERRWNAAINRDIIISQYQSLLGSTEPAGKGPAVSPSGTGAFG